MKRKGLLLVLLLLLVLGLQLDLDAQCAMCKAVLESNMQSGEDAVGRGINSGIMYIMFVPYLLIGVAGFFMYRHYQKNKSIS